MRTLPLFVIVALAVPSLARSAPTQAAPQAGTAARSSAPAEDSAKPAAPPSSQARAMSKALVPKQTWDRLLDRSAEGLSAAVSRSLTDKGNKVPNDLQGSIRRELAQNMKYESAIDTQAQALQKRFTPQEMDTAAKFYSSAVGQKVLQQLPEAQSEVGNQLQEQLATVVPDIIQRVAPDAASPGGAAGGATPRGGAPSAGSRSPGTEGTGSSP